MLGLGGLYKRSAAARAARARMTRLSSTFELRSSTQLSDWDCELVKYVHKPTGCEVYSAHTSDNNKTFGAMFRTPPLRNTGAAHIVEHCVLCGGEKYSARDPFLHMLKSSLQTFLNAMTYSDRTVYPVASTNVTDIYNLADVYCDAVLRPKLQEFSFMQEGWRLQNDGENGSNRVHGVVYNEMKGVYSSPHAQLDHEMSQRLFPDTHYALDNGGSPAEIPSLPYQEFKQYHAKHYHPSNAAMWWYGDHSEERRLQFLEEHLKGFSRSDRAQFNSAPVDIKRSYLSDGSEESHHCSYSIVCGDKRKLSQQERIFLSIIHKYLVDMPNSILRRELLDSGLADSVSGYVDLDSAHMVLMFNYTARSAEAAEQCKQRVQEVLQACASKRIDEDVVDGIMSTYEFDVRALAADARLPKGVIMHLVTAGEWAYDSDPLDSLRFTDAIQTARDTLSKDKDVLTRMMQQYIQENTHKAFVWLYPTQPKGGEHEEAEKRAAATAESHMSEADLQAIGEKTHAFEAFQAAADDGVHTLPSLELSEIDKKAKELLYDVNRVEGGVMLTNELDTNGIAQINATYDVKKLPVQFLPLLPIFAQALRSSGTSTYSRDELEKRVMQHTGGITVRLYTHECDDRTTHNARLHVDGRALEHKCDELTALMTDITANTVFDRSRVTAIVREALANAEVQILQSGNAVAARHIGKAYSVSGWLQDVSSGVSYLRFLRELSAELSTEEGWQRVHSDLQFIQQTLFRKQNSVIACSAQHSAMQSSAKAGEGLLRALPDTPAVTEAAWTHHQCASQALGGAHTLNQHKTSTLPSLPVLSALTAPLDVNFTAKVFARAIDTDHQIHDVAPGHLIGSGVVAAGYLTTSFLWEAVRMTGGAYGVNFTYNPYTHIGVATSFRDPHSLQTLRVFEGIADELEGLSQRMPTRTLHDAIIATIGHFDAPHGVSHTNQRVLNRYLLGITQEKVQEQRDAVLHTTRQQFADFAHLLRSSSAHACAAVTCGAHVAQELEDKGAITTKLL